MRFFGAPAITVISAFIVALSSGCGGRTNGPSGEPADGAVGFDAPSTEIDSGVIADSPDSSGAWSPVCPESPPQVGSACSISETTQCEYGDAWWNVACDQVFVCAGGQWELYHVSPDACLPEPGPNSPSCPTNAGAIGNAACPQAGLYCYYGQGANCDCFAQEDALPPTWHCLPAGPSCPPNRPRLGSACTDNAAVCVYAFCTYEQDCVDGLWQGHESGC